MEDACNIRLSTRVSIKQLPELQKVVLDVRTQKMSFSYNFYKHVHLRKILSITMLLRSELNFVFLVSSINGIGFCAACNVR